VTLRHWAPGDRFQPSGLPKETKVQDLLTNIKVRAPEKRRRLLAVAQDGKIFWVEGLRISERHKVAAQTRRLLRWVWRRVK
jgi:tRNA(Ile)-lysidine synthetase-like protein